MEQAKPITHIAAGLMIAGAVILLSIVMNFTGNAGNSAASWLTYLIIIGGLIFFVNRYGQSKNYTETFGNLFSFGFKTTAVFTILFIVFLIIFNLLFPEFKEKAMEMARQKLEDQKTLNDDQIDQALEMTKKYFWLFVIGGSMLGFVIVGAIGSLIGAAVTKKLPQTPFDQQIS